MHLESDEVPMSASGPTLSGYIVLSSCEKDISGVNSLGTTHLN